VKVTRDPVQGDDAAENRTQWPDLRAHGELEGFEPGEFNRFRDANATEEMTLLRLSATITCAFIYRAPTELLFVRTTVLLIPTFSKRS